MRRFGLVVLTSLGCACGPAERPSGAIGTKAAPLTADPAESDDKQEDEPTPATEDPPEQGEPEVAEQPPIEILNARMYDGFVVGGLPSKEQIDQALEGGFESAMSLMAKSETQGVEIAQYAASRGVRYLKFTIDGKAELTEAMAWQFAATLSMLDRPAIIHSDKGRRVGAIFALKAFFVDERPADEALRIGRSAGMGDFESHVRGLIAP